MRQNVTMKNCETKVTPDDLQVIQGFRVGVKCGVNLQSVITAPRGEVNREGLTILCQPQYSHDNLGGFSKAERRWSHGPCRSLRSEPMSQLGPLPSGWAMCLTSTACVYFVHHNTKTAT